MDCGKDANELLLNKSHAVAAAESVHWVTIKCKMKEVMESGIHTCECKHKRHT